MPVNLQDLAAQDAAYAKAGNDAQTAEQARQTLGAQGQPKGILSWMTQMPQRITGDMIDSAVHAADSMAHDGSWGEAATRVGRDVAAGAASAAKNTAGAVVDFANAMDNGRAEKDLAETGGKGMSQREMQRALEAEDPAMEARDRAMGDSAEQLDYGQNPIWNHARQAILDFRDAVAVKDPNLVDNLTQSVAQLAIPFAGYSRALGEVHTFADMASESPKLVQFGAKMLDEALATTRAGAVTDATALSPHSMRFADLIALGRHTEGKLGEALRAIDPSGSAQDAYIRYLTDRDDEGAAEGRFKNVLDGFTVNNLVTPLLTAAGSVLKQGTAGLRYLIDNGVPSMDKMPLPPQAFQEGKIVFHGTPHDFDEFDNSKIGTGEGNQTFGHGLYFAEHPDVAGMYAETRPNDRITSADREAYFQPGRVRNLHDGVKDKILSYDPVKGYVTAERTDPAFGNQPQKVTYGDAGADWQDIRRGLGQPLYKHGKLYTVDIPDEHIANMADWDQPLSAQPRLQQALRDLNVSVEPHGSGWRVMVDGKPGPQYLTRQAALSETDLLRGESQNVDGGMAYQQLAEALRSQKAASKYLASKGITGLRYLDAGSRDAKSGTRNIVLFDAKKAKILSKSEKPRA